MIAALVLCVVGQVHQLPLEPILPAERFDSAATFNLHLAEVTSEREKLRDQIKPLVAGGAKVLYIEHASEDTVKLLLAIVHDHQKGQTVSPRQRAAIAGWWWFVALGELKLKPWPVDGEVGAAAIVLGGE